MYFEYVRFLVKPDTDMEMFLEKVNKAFVNEKSRFYLVSDTKIEEMNTIPYYRDVSNLVIFGISILLIFMGCLIVYYVFIRKRMKKEQHILKQYGYSCQLEKNLRILVYNTIALLIIVIFGNPICSFVNQFAIVTGYGKFLDFNIGIVLASYGFILILNRLCEWIVGEVRV